LAITLINEGISVSHEISRKAKTKTEKNYYYIIGENKPFNPFESRNHQNTGKT
jgi:hypothetical protein